MFKKFFEGFSKLNLIAGLQQVFVMFGATVIVPLLTGLDVGVALIAAGVGTIIFHIVTGFGVPIFLGSSFAFIPPIIAISKMSGGSLPMALGGVAVAGLLYIVVALIFTKVKPEKLWLVLPPVVTGSIIILIGLLLAPVAINNIGAGGVVWLTAFITFTTGVFIKVYVGNRNKFFGTLPIIFSLAVGYIVATLFGLVDFTYVAQASWIGIPKFSLPIFNWSAIAIAVPVAIVTIIEHFGDIVAVGGITGKDYIKSPGIHRTLIGDGIATTLSAMIGGPANTTYSENTGSLALTGNHNPVIMRIAALFAILLGFVPKFTAIIQSIPGPVIGGISVLLFGMIAATGIRTMVDNKVDLSLPNNLIVCSAILVIGLGVSILDIGGFKISGLGLASIVGIILNFFLNKKSFGIKGKEYEIHY